jgi:predicted DNA-binding protein (UPF0251 family)
MARESLVMAERTPRAAAEQESEPVVIKHEGAEVVLRLDDGEDLRFDRKELRTALDRAA